MRPFLMLEVRLKVDRGMRAHVTPQSVRGSEPQLPVREQQKKPHKNAKEIMSVAETR